MYAPVGITAGTSSYDTPPTDHLDPALFDGHRLKPDVRAGLLSLLSDFVSARYRGVNGWMRAWLAGSGASYRWQGSGGDLDVLIGINGVGFRMANQEFIGMGDVEIAKHVNEELRAGLWPATAHWMGRYEVTWYVNPRSYDISVINPYAAYDLIGDGWTVPPTPVASEVKKEWRLWADIYRQRAETAVSRYSQALTDLAGATNPASRSDAESRFHLAVSASVSLYHTVHSGRSTAFSPKGGGYDDFSNYLWQQGKAGGWIDALRMIDTWHKEALSQNQVSTYGLELPDTDVLIRRAAMAHRIDR